VTGDGDLLLIGLLFESFWQNVCQKLEHVQSSWHLTFSPKWVNYEVSGKPKPPTYLATLPPLLNDVRIRIAAIKNDLFSLRKTLFSHSDRRN